MAAATRRTRTAAAMSGRPAPARLSNGVRSPDPLTSRMHAIPASPSWALADLVRTMAVSKKRCAEAVAIGQGEGANLRDAEVFAGKRDLDMLAGIRTQPPTLILSLQKSELHQNSDSTWLSKKDVEILPHNRHSA
ncbi:unnamed protein product [Urochloa humidicola]